MLCSGVRTYYRLDSKGDTHHVPRVRFQLLDNPVYLLHFFICQVGVGSAMKGINSSLLALGVSYETYGAVLVGAFVSAVLYGVTNAQVFVYFRENTNDKLIYKLAVSWLWLLDTLHVALGIHMVYFYLITNFSDRSQLAIIVWSFKVQIVVGTVLTMSVHTLYCVRIWKFNAITNHNRELSKGTVFAVTSFAMFFGYIVGLALCWAIYYHFVLYEDFSRPTGKMITYIPAATGTIIDVIFAVCLCYLLARCRTGFWRTDSTIAWLTFYTLNSGLATAIIQLMIIITMAALPHTFAMIACFMLVSKLYVNSYMAMFNARNSLRGSGECIEDLSIRRSGSPLAESSSITSRGIPISTNHGYKPYFTEHEPIRLRRRGRELKFNRDTFAEEFAITRDSQIIDRKRMTTRPSEQHIQKPPSTYGGYREAWLHNNTLHNNLVVNKCHLCHEHRSACACN